MARYARGQRFFDTLLAQRAMYYYSFYFLLHQLKIRPKDLEKIFIVFGLIHVALYLFQFFLYPTVIFNPDINLRFDRGTVRIYMAGSDYLVISFFMSLQAFFRTNKTKYLLLGLLFFSIFILLGGRQTMALMAFTMILFLLFSKKVKSRLFIGLLVAISISLVFIMFRGIFEAMLTQSVSDMSLGSDYIRIRTAKYFLTDFFKSPLAYITGNGMYSSSTAYGNEIGRLSTGNRYTLGDIGLIGNYAIYGAFFLLGVIGICVKALRTKIEENKIYIRYVFIAIILSLITGGGFTQADFICAIVSLLYIIDVSNYFQRKELKSDPDN